MARITASRQLPCIIASAKPEKGKTAIGFAASRIQLRRTLVVRMAIRAGTDSCKH